MSTEPTRPTPRPARRCALRGLALVVGLVAVLPTSVSLALETDAARDAITRRAAEVGVRLTWKRLHSSLLRAHLEFEGVEVETAEAKVGIGALAVRWRWRALLGGGVHVDALSLDDVSVTLAAAGDDAAAPGEGPASPRSALLASLADGPALGLDALDVRRLSVRLTTGGREVTLSDLAVSGSAHVGGRTAPRLRVSLGGLVLDAEGAEERPLHARLEASAVATLEGPVLDLDARVVARALEGPVPAPLGSWLESRAQLAFEPGRRRVRVEVPSLTLLDGAGTGRLTLRLDDDAVVPVLEAGGLELDVDRLGPLARLALPDLETRGARLVLSSTPAGASDELLVKAAFDAERLAALDASLDDTHLQLDAVLAPNGWPRRVTTALRAKRVHGAGAALDDLESHATAALTESGREGELTLTVARLAMEDGPTPVEARALTLTATARGVSPALTSGAFEVKARLATLQAITAGGDAIVTEPRLQLEGHFAEGRATATVSMPTGALRLREPGRSVVFASSALDATLSDLDVSRRAGRAKFTLPLRELRAELSGAVARMSSMTLSGDLGGTFLGAVALSGTTGFELQGVHAEREGRAVDLRRLGSALEVDLRGDTLRRLGGHVVTAGLRATSVPGQAPLAFGDGRLELSGVDLGAARGRLALKGALPPLTMDLDANVQAHRLLGTLRARVAPLAPLLPLVPALPAGASLELSTSELDVNAMVRVDDVREPWRVLADEARLTLTGVHGRWRGQALEAERATLALTHQHEAQDDTVHLEVQLERPRLDDVGLDGGLGARLDAEIHRARGEGRLAVGISALGEDRLTSTLHFRRERDGRVHHELSAKAKALAPLAPLAAALALVPPEFDLARLGATLSSSGDTLGLLDAKLEPLPDWQALSDTTLGVRLSVTDLAHHSDGEEVKVPRVDFEVDGGVLHGAVHVYSKVEIPRVDVDLGAQHLTLTGLHQVLRARSDVRPDAGLLHLSVDGVIDDVEQNLLPPWRPTGVHVAGAARVDRLAALSVDSFLVESERGGTRLELKKRLRRDAQPTAPAGPDGGALWNPGGQRFLLEGRLEQDLARLDGAPKTFTGHGRLAMPLTVDSADHTLFRARGRLELADVDARLPGEGLTVEGATGTIPLEEAITFDPAVGLKFVPSSERHVFARARYQDVQPFLSADSLVTVKRVQVGDFAFGPVVASLEVDRNRFSLNKLKAERGPARLSGQLFVDYLPGAESITFRGSITGLPREGADTPLDANAAIVFSPSGLELDGRVQVVRTSKEHLLDLLDVLDPHREVASLNRLRDAMRFGYPRSAQLSFGAGLMSMDVAFGGLAGLFDLGTVGGVSLGPFFTRHLAPRVARSPTP